MMILYFHSWSRQLMRAAGFDILARGSVRLARRLAAVARRRTAILTLQRLDDRTLADIGVSRSEIEFAVRSGAAARNPRPAQRHRGLKSMLSHDAGPLDTGPKPRGIVALYPACRWFAAIKKQRIGSRWSLGVFAATRRFAFGMADRLG